MDIDIEKLTSVLRRLADRVGGCIVESAVWIGEVDGKPVRISIATKDEA